MEQLLVMVNKSKDKVRFYSTDPRIDATGLDQADYLTIKRNNGEVFKLDRAEVTQWWEKDTEDGSILKLEEGGEPMFANAADAARTKMDTYFRDACTKLSDGTIQPFDEFECVPSKATDEVGYNNKVVPLVDPDEMREMMEFDRDELGEIDDFKHSGIYSAYYFICWTNRKDFEAALPKPRLDSKGVKMIDTDKIDTSRAMILKPNDFYYLNDKNKIYAYIEKSVELNVPRQERQRLE